jgi:cytochrome c peroxidase
MGMPDEKSVEKRLSNEEKYRNMFAEAFPEDKNPITYDNMKKAIGAFERKLMTPSRFDAFLSGDEKALNAEEIKGLETFLDKGCASCHNGPAIGGGNFQKFGVFVDYWTLTHSDKIDKGRFEVTNNEADMYVFKTPSLRNITKTYPYFHDGSVKDLKEAIKIMGKTQLNHDLTDEEINSITVFLESLTGNIPEDLKN